MGEPEQRPDQGARHQGQKGFVPVGCLGPRHRQRPRRKLYQVALFDDSPKARGHGRILDGCMVGMHASNMIGEIVLVIEMGSDIGDIGKTIHPPFRRGESIGMKVAEVTHWTCTDMPKARK